MKKLLALLLALLMCLALLPSAVAEKEDSDELTEEWDGLIDSSSEVDEILDCDSDGNLLETSLLSEDYSQYRASSSGVLQKMEIVNSEINNDFPSKLFTVNGKVCSSHTSYDGTCDNCEVKHIYQAKKGSTYPGTSAWTCAAFARYYFYCVFGKCSEYHGWTKQGLAANVQSSYDSVMPGDYLKLSYSGGTHYAIFVSADSSGVTVHNANQSSPRKIDLNKKFSYSSKYFGGTMSYIHADNYSEVNSQYSSPEAQYLAQCTTYPTYGTVKITGTTVLKSLPCSKSTSEYSTDIATLSSGTKDVIAVYKNTAGNYWYKTTYNGKECYLYSGNTSWSSWKGTDITLSNATNPSQLTQGKAFSIKGTISSTYNTMTALYAYCYPGSATSGTASISSSHTGLSTKSYSLGGSTLDSNLKFGNLSSGNYTYALKAKCVYYYSNNGTSLSSATSSEYLIHSNPFAVGASYYLDLNGYLDGTSTGNISGYGTADIYINGSLVSSGCTDHYAAYSSGSTYEIRNIKAAAGKEYVGVYSGSLSGTLNSAKTVVLQFRTASYTVTFNANGGSVSTSSKTVTYGSTYGTLPTPTRTGYTFDGWYTATSGGSKVTSSTTVTTASNHTLYAHWTANTYTVTFDATGGSVSQTSKKITFGSTYGELPQPTRAGYTFDGWYCVTDQGQHIDIDATTTVWIASDHILYASWILGDYTVYFNANGGSVSTQSKTVIYSKTYGALPTPTWTGHTFDGWYTAASGGSLVTASTTVTATSNHTLYAHWIVNEYLVSFDRNDGSGLSEGSIWVIYGNTYGWLPTPTRTGYTFSGWYTAANGGSQVTSSTTVSTASNHTLYAHWMEDQLPAFDGTIEWNSADVEYKGTTPYVIANGKAQMPRFTVKDKYGKVVSASNYTYEYRENTNAGTGYVIVTFKSIYSGTAQTWFKIYLPPTTMTTVENVGKGIMITWDPVPGAAGYVIYRRAWSSKTNGWTTFERWWNVTGTSWIDGSDSSHRVYAGSRYQYGIKAYFAQRVDPISGATIGGNVGDNYNLGVVGPLKTTVRITTLVLNSVTAGTKQLTVKWTEKPEYTGYEIQIATDASFTKNVKTVTITDPTASQTTVKNLKSNTTYYIRIRAYHVFEEMKYYGKWTDSLSCKVK